MLAHAALLAGPPPGYYDPVQGKIGADLRLALHSIIRNHRTLPYSGSPQPDTADAHGFLDEDPANPENLIGLEGMIPDPFLSSNPDQPVYGLNRIKSKVNR